MPLPTIAQNGDRNSVRSIRGSRLKHVTTVVLPIKEESTIEVAVEEMQLKPTRAAFVNLAKCLEREVHPFNRLQHETVLMLLGECHLRRFQAGELIYHKGERSKSVMFVISGKVRLSNRADYFGKICRKGDILCEETLFPTSEFVRKIVKLETKEFPKL